MDEKLKVLIALGASVSAHCFFCLDFNLKKAKKLGLADEEVHEAIRVGLTVMNAPQQKMIEKIKGSLSGISIKGNKSCSSSQRKSEIRLFPSIHM